MRGFFIGLLMVCGSAFAQSYPTKPVRLIVAYPPGGSSDLMARVFGAKLSELWGQQVIVESKPGAAGAIGTEYAARQPADGYTFMLGNSGPVAINPLLSPVPYNVERDFIPVSQISAGPNVLVVRKSQADKIKTIADLRGKKIGISAPGASTHNFVAGLMERAGVPWKEASYISIGTGLSAVAAVRAGQELDAIVNLDPAINAIVDAGDGVVLADSRTEEGTRAAFGGHPSLRSGQVEWPPHRARPVSTQLGSAMRSMR